MDPKLNQLDPKLKATYERIMGTSFQKPTTVVPPSNIPTTTPTPSVIKPPPSTPVQTSQTSTPSPTPQVFPVLQEQTPKPFQPQTVMVNTPQPTAKTETSQTAQKPNKMTTIFIVLGGIIFILAYALLWIRIFKLKVNFLPF